jgi:hypothetical protein
MVFKKRKERKQEDCRKGRQRKRLLQEEERGR